MKIPYTQFDDGSLAPLLEVSLQMPRGFARVMMLVDSGANETLLPATMLSVFGAESVAPPIDMCGLGATIVKGWPATLAITAAGHPFVSRVVGLEDRRMQSARLGPRGSCPPRESFQSSRRALLC